MNDVFAEEHLRYFDALRPDFINFKERTFEFMSDPFSLRQRRKGYCVFFEDGQPFVIAGALDGVGDDGFIFDRQDFIFREAVFKKGFYNAIKLPRLR